MSFTKYGRSITSANLCADYVAHKEFPKWVTELFRNELHVLFIHCRNLDDAKSNAIIKKFLKILVLEIGEQIFDDAVSKFHSTFIEWRHILWTKINKLFTNLQTRTKSDDINALFVNISANDVSNDFEKSLLDIVCAGIWAINFYDPKNAQILFFNLNNDLYTVNLNVLTLSSWNVATSINL
ncbi:40762_t:CDS:2, partial [Gigaspora margarita]